MYKKIDNILEIFLRNPNKKINVREAARLVKINPSTASKYLSMLEKQKILKKEKDRNFLFFSANTENYSYRDLKIYNNIKNIRNSGLVIFLENELNYPEIIMLFGSYSKGENIEKSDIDIFILSESRNKIDLTIFEKKLRAAIQIFVYSRNDLEKMKKTNKELLNNILNGIRLSGFLEVFK